MWGNQKRSGCSWEGGGSWKAGHTQVSDLRQKAALPTTSQEGATTTHVQSGAGPLAPLPSSPGCTWAPCTACSVRGLVLGTERGRGQEWPFLADATRLPEHGQGILSVKPPLDKYYVQYAVRTLPKQLSQKATPWWGEPQTGELRTPRSLRPLSSHYTP